MGVTWSGASGRHTRGTLAVGAAVASLVGLTPAAATADRLPSPALTGRQIAPSTCATRDAPLVYARRPTLTVNAGVPVPAGTRLQVEIYPGNAGLFEAEGYDMTPQHVSTTAPLRAGSRTFAWRPRQPLTAEAHDWRARLVREGRAVTGWSRWGNFTIDPAFPRLQACRFTAGELQAAAEHAEDRGWSLRRQLADDAWRQDFYRLAARLATRHPRAFVAGESVNAHRRVAWVAFRAGAPAAARESLARFVRTHPGSEVDILTGRDYSERGLQRRADLILDAVLESGLVDPSWSGAYAELRTGTITVSVANEAELNLTDSALRTRLRRAITSRMSGYQIVAPGPGVLAGPARQPVRIEIRPDT